MEEYNLATAQAADSSNSMEVFSKSIKGAFTKPAELKEAQK